MRRRFNPLGCWCRWGPRTFAAQVVNVKPQHRILLEKFAIEELHLIAKQDDLEGIEARRLTDYARLQRAAGGARKWIP